LLWHVSYFVGDRGQKSAVMFISDLRRRVTGPPQITTNPWVSPRDGSKCQWSAVVA